MGIQEEKRTLAAAGADFPGSHICRQLVQPGHDVVCVENLYCITKRGIVELLDQPDFEYLQANTSVRGKEISAMVKKST